MSRESDKHVDMTSDMVCYLYTPLPHQQSENSQWAQKNQNSRAPQSTQQLQGRREEPPPARIARKACGRRWRRASPARVPTEGAMNNNEQ